MRCVLFPFAGVPHPAHVKLLVFAHTPPPHHGQSQMIAHLVEGFGGDVRHSAGAKTPPHGIELYHVNSRLSDDLEDVGSVRWGKVFTLLKYCAQAIAIRFRHGVHNFYYVPSPPKRSSLYRDWIVMMLCRPFFRRIILHWHSVGLGEWLDTEAHPWERAVTRLLLGDVSLSILLSRFNEADAALLSPRFTAVVANGIPDPCPNHLPKPLQRTEELGDTSRIRTVRVLFLALCTHDKGVHDAVRGVLAANEIAAASRLGVRFELTVAGSFVTDADRAEFAALCSRVSAANVIRHVGFLSGEAKADMLRKTDLFCFPTYYANEGQPLNLIEAMAYGIPAVTTRWRAIPELFPVDYPGIVEPKKPEDLARALLAMALHPDGDKLRRRFEEMFKLDRHLKALAAALHGLEPAPKIQ